LHGRLTAVSCTALAKATTLLWPCHAEFTTFQVDKSVSTGKVWCLHRKATLEPANSRLIRAHERHLRKAGPVRALAAYARDKNLLKLVSNCRSDVTRGYLDQQLSMRGGRTSHPQLYRTECTPSYKQHSTCTNLCGWPSGSCGLVELMRDLTICALTHFLLHTCPLAVLLPGGVARQVCTQPGFHGGAWV
jgi:hypothetical protein